jgi:hypothetical protein
MKPADRLSLARAAALIAVAELGVHQLRYLLAFGGAAGQQLAHQGHSYLGAAAPVLGTIAVSAIAAGVLRAALCGEGSAGGATLRRRVTLFSLAVLVVYCAQELAEGALSPGHPAGPAALLADGGLLALPLSITLGALGALLDRGFSGLERLVVAHRRPRRRRPRPAPRTRVHRSPGRPIRAASPLAFGLARRPPPLPS